VHVVAVPDGGLAHRGLKVTKPAVDLEPLAGVVLVPFASDLHADMDMIAVVSHTDEPAAAGAERARQRIEGTAGAVDAGAVRAVRAALVRVVKVVRVKPEVLASVL
jgi:hypothetical protein